MPTEQEIQLLIGAVTLGMTGLLFPFVLYFFKKNERLHEETKQKIGQHDTTLATHEVRIVYLEAWKTASSQPVQQQPQTNVNVN